MLPSDCPRTLRFEFELVLSFECLVFRKSRLRLDLPQGARGTCAPMARFLSLRPARNHRAARNQTGWLTEVGRLHQAPQGKSARTPLYILRGLQKGKTQRLWVQSEGPRVEALHLGGLHFHRWHAGSPQCLLTRSTIRIRQDLGEFGD